MVQALAILDDRKNCRSTFAHLRRIPLHDLQISTNGLGKVNLVDHQQIRARDTRSTLARNLVATRNVNHIDDEVGQLARVVRSEVITAGLDEEEICGELPLQVLQCEQVGTDVLADGGVRAAAGLDGANTRRGEGLVAGEELGVFPVDRKDIVRDNRSLGVPSADLPGKDIVRYGGNVIFVTHGQAKCAHESCLARSNGSGVARVNFCFGRSESIARVYIVINSIQSTTELRYIPANSNRERAVFPVPALDQRHLTVNVRAGTIQDIVGMAVAIEGVVVGVADAIVVGVRVGHGCSIY